MSEEDVERAKEKVVELRRANQIAGSVVCSHPEHKDNPRPRIIPEQGVDLRAGLFTVEALCDEAQKEAKRRVREAFG